MSGAALVKSLRETAELIVRPDPRTRPQLRQLQHGRSGAAAVAAAVEVELGAADQVDAAAAAAAVALGRRQQTTDGGTTYASKGGFDRSDSFQLQPVSFLLHSVYSEVLWVSPSFI